MSAHRLVEETFTSREVADLIDELGTVVKIDVESELIDSAHTTALLLKQVQSIHDPHIN